MTTDDFLNATERVYIVYGFKRCFEKRNIELDIITNDYIIEF